MDLRAALKEARLTQERLTAISGIGSVVLCKF